MILGRGFVELLAVGDHDFEEERRLLCGPDSFEW